MYNETTHAGDLAHDDHDSHGPARGLMRWVTTTNHKDIGTLYLWLAFIMLLFGGSMAMVIRLELFQPGLQWVQPQFFNQMTTPLRSGRSRSTRHPSVRRAPRVRPRHVAFRFWVL